MTEHLFRDAGDGDPGGFEDPGDAGERTPPLRVVPLQGGGHTTRTEQAWETAREALTGWRHWLERERVRPGSILHDHYNYRPATVQEALDAAKAREWVPPGHENGLSGPAGEAYRLRFAIPVRRLCFMIIATAEQPLVMAWVTGVALSLIIPTILLLLWVAGQL
jgi:hypothetical protein